MNAPAASALGPCPHCGEQHAEDVLVCPKTEKYMPLQGRLLDHKFRFKKLLGEGGMGSVWKAHHELVAKDVAIKLMHPEFASNPNILDRFRKEAQAAGRIGSVHICDIMDFGKSVLGPYIVMEMMVGQPLDGLITSSGQVDPGLAVLVMRQALEGLAAAHDAGIVHRDLKPDNIFLNEPEPGRLLVKLVDFGISKFTEAAGSGKTGVGVLMGTPEYMSPEQAEGAANVDARTDIWAMGAILYQSLSGQQPFSGATMAQTLVALSTREPTPLKSMVPTLPDELVAIVERCLKKNPDERFQTARELSAALAPFEQTGTVVMPAAGAAVHTLAPNSPTPPPNTIGGGATVVTGGSPGVAAGSFSRGQTQLSDNQDWSLGDVDEQRPPSSLGGGSSSGGSKMGLIIGLVLLLLAGGGVAAFVLTQAPPDASDSGTEVASAESAGESGESDGKSSDADADSGTPAADSSGESDAKAAGSDGDAKSAESSGDSGDTKAGDSGDEDSGDEDSGDDDSGDDDSGDDDDDDSSSNSSSKKKKKTTKKPSVKPDMSVLVQSGNLYTHKTPNVGSTLANAKSACNRLKRKGLGNLTKWKLASSGQITKFRGKPGIKPLLYWSSDKPTAGKGKVVFLVNGRTQERAVDDKKARAFCVSTK